MLLLFTIGYHSRSNKTYKSKEKVLHGARKNWKLWDIINPFGFGFFNLCLKVLSSVWFGEVSSRNVYTV